MESHPRVDAVQPLPGRRLRVHFSNGHSSVYDCSSLLADPAFRQLAEEAFFRNVRADPHGFGVVWSDEVDLSESELWLHGTAQDGAGYA
jgi:hypothetical protein